jgi:hypothetical protein
VSTSGAGWRRARWATLFIALACGDPPPATPEPPPEVPAADPPAWGVKPVTPTGLPIVHHRDLRWTANPSAWPPDPAVRTSQTRRCSARVEVLPTGALRVVEIRGCEASLHTKATAVLASWRVDPASLPTPGQSVASVVLVHVDEGPP